MDSGNDKGKKGSRYPLSTLIASLFSRKEIVESDPLMTDPPLLTRELISHADTADFGAQRKVVIIDSSVWCWQSSLPTYLARPPNYPLQHQYPQSPDRRVVFRGTLEEE